MDRKRSGGCIGHVLGDGLGAVLSPVRFGPVLRSPEFLGNSAPVHLSLRLTLLHTHEVIGSSPIAPTISLASPHQLASRSTPSAPQTGQTLRRDCNGIDLHNYAMSICNSKLLGLFVTRRNSIPPSRSSGAFRHAARMALRSKSPSVTATNVSRGWPSSTARTPPTSRLLRYTTTSCGVALDDNADAIPTLTRLLVAAGSDYRVQ